MEKEKIISSGILEQYVLGLTTPEQDAELERMIKKYPEVRKELEILQKDMHHYSLHQGIEPPKAMRVKQRSAMLFSGFAIIIIMALGVLSWRLNSSRTAAFDKIAMLKQELYLLKEDHAELITSNLQTKKELAFLRDVDTRQLILQQDTVPTEMVIFWNDHLKNAFLRIADMPPLPEDQQYQLWAEVNGSYESIGLLETPGYTDMLRPLDYIESCKGIYVTVEETGGAQSFSTQNMYASGAF